MNPRPLVVLLTLVQPDTTEKWEHEWEWFYWYVLLACWYTSQSTEQLALSEKTNSLE